MPIVNPGFFKRIIINGLIKFASYFTKSKIIQRIEFVEMETVDLLVPEKSRPSYSLSKPERITSVQKFLHRRLSMYPLLIGAKNCLSEITK